VAVVFLVKKSATALLGKNTHKQKQLNVNIFKGVNRLEFKQYNQNLILQRLPKGIAPYVEPFFNINELLIYLAPKRKTKLGDFKAISKSNFEITVNNELSLNWFILTLLHEIAHYQVYKTHGRKVLPHGQEWKNQLSHWVYLMLKNIPFEPDFKAALADYALNPRASVNAHKPLYAFYKKEHNVKEKIITGTQIKELVTGDVFNFKERNFKIIEFKRTRVLALDLADKKQYLISVNAEIKKLEAEPIVQNTKKTNLKLAELTLGSTFMYNGQKFKLLAFKNTKAVIEDNKQKKYLLSKLAEIAI